MPSLTDSSKAAPGTVRDGAQAGRGPRFALPCESPFLAWNRTALTGDPRSTRRRYVLGAGGDPLPSLTAVGSALFGGYTASSRYPCALTTGV